MFLVVHCALQIKIEVTMCPKNEQEWWGLVDEHWGHLLRIIGDQMDLYSPALEPPGQGDGEMTGHNVLEEILLLKKDKNPKLARYFSGTWCLASNAYAYSVPSWGVLCDLCSEEYVLYPERPWGPT